MPYVNFISDTHFLTCVENLYNSYVKANKDIDKRKLYDNKIDIVKLTFDKHFGTLQEDELIKREIQRQVDKSVTNAIGTFHEEILGGIKGYSRGNLSGYDIKADDDTMFADIKNKHNTMNSSSTEALYQKLERFANEYPNSKCYWVQILAIGSFNEHWSVSFDKGTRKYNHSNVYKISGDKFYELLSGERDALYNIYKALPVAINDYLTSINVINTDLGNTSTAFQDIQQLASRHSRMMLNQIAVDNFGYYNGFDKL